MVFTFFLKVLKHLLQLIPQLEPFTMTTVTGIVSKAGSDVFDDLQLHLLEALKLLMERYSSTSDLCVLQTITLLQVISISKIRSSTTKFPF